MPKGRHKQHKGRAKHYLNPEEVREQEQRKKREEDWKRKKGIQTDKPDEEEEESGSGDEGGAVGGTRNTHLSPGDLPPSSSSDEESSDDDLGDQFQKSKGVEGLIDIENPNRVTKKTKKVRDIDINAKVELSRREREEIERQRDAATYRRLHEAGRTEEARRDLARLAIIRQQREEAARKKEAERKAQEAKEKKKK